MAAKEIKLEDAIKKLSEIVKKLENNESELDESLKLFEEGVALARNCHQKLDETEKKIEVLTKASNTGVETKPYSK